MQQIAAQAFEQDFPCLEPQFDHGAAQSRMDAILDQKRRILTIKRIYDVIFSFVGLVFLVPLFVMVAAIIKLDSPGPFFYTQIRVGKDGRPFRIFKFRKMYDHVGESGLKLTMANDQRMTRVGGFLRKSKIDELPQIFNVLKGDMAIVGPRPEIPDYVSLYTAEQRQVLRVKPGITDYASIYYINEGDLLEQAADPETYYIESVMPQKIQLNIRYFNDMSLFTDLKLICLTFKNIVVSMRREKM